MTDARPVLAICGWSGSGKTTLIEAVLPQLVARGLAVAVVKHDTHGIDVDRPGKDSDRLYRAGADVVLGAPDELLRRAHRSGGVEARSFERILGELLVDHDLVLVEGHKETPLPKVWLSSEDDPAPPSQATHVLEVLSRDALRPERLDAFLSGWLPQAWRKVPTVGAVLFGGNSSRMGTPKQLLEFDGRTFVERVHEALAARLDRVVLLGQGPLPPGLAAAPVLADPPGPGGPLAALLGALRWAPRTALLAAACDQAFLEPEAVDWLIAQRAPGVWAILPRISDGNVEPFGALYEPQARALLEELAGTSRKAPRLLEGHAKVRHPRVPDGLVPCWRALNTPQDLRDAGVTC